STLPRPPSPPLFPYTTLFRSDDRTVLVLPAFKVATGHQSASTTSTLPVTVSLSSRAMAFATDSVLTIDGKLFGARALARTPNARDRKSTRLNSSHQIISYAVF